MMVNGESINQIYFFHVGVAHIYGYFEWNGEKFRHKVVTLQEGAWFGDYQVMLNIVSSWDLVAGGDEESR